MVSAAVGGALRWSGRGITPRRETGKIFPKGVTINLKSEE